MMIYRTSLGDAHVAVTYDSEKYKGIKSDSKMVGFNTIKKIVRRPPNKPNSNDAYDSIVGESIANGGSDLAYREIILYERGQAYPEYLVIFKREKTKVFKSDITKEQVLAFVKST